MIKHQEVMQLFLIQHLGVPYIWGGDDPIAGFDCSGFAQEFLNAFGGHPSPGRDLTAQGLYDQLVKKGNYNVKQTGSLAFYGKSFREITHVAVLLNVDLIFEFGGGGPKTRTEADAIAQNAYGRIRPLTRRSDLLACIQPKFTYA